LTRFQRGDKTGAETQFRRLLTLLERQPKRDAVGIAFALGYLGGLAYDDERLSEAASTYTRALAACDTSSACDERLLFDILHGLAETARRLGNNAQAEPLAQRGLALAERRFGERSPQAANVLQSLGRLYLDTNRHAAAEPLLQRARAIREGSEGAGALGLAITLRLLSWIDAWRGRFVEGEWAARITSWHSSSLTAPGWPRRWTPSPTRTRSTGARWRSPTPMRASRSMAWRTSWRGAPACYGRCIARARR